MDIEMSSTSVQNHPKTYIRTASGVGEIDNDA